jgi:hypothetical protein
MPAAIVPYPNVRGRESKKLLREVDLCTYYIRETVRQSWIARVSTGIAPVESTCHTEKMRPGSDRFMPAADRITVERGSRAQTVFSLLPVALYL